MALVDIKKGVYSAVSEAYGSEVAALEATANDANVESTSDRLTDWINEGGRLMARYGVALRGRRAKELTAREVVKLADLDLIQSPPGLAGTADCGAPWAAYRFGYGPAGALGSGGVALAAAAVPLAYALGFSVAPAYGISSPSLAAVWGVVDAGPLFFGATSGIYNFPSSSGARVEQSLGAVATFSARRIGVLSFRVAGVMPGAWLNPGLCQWFISIRALNASGVVVYNSAPTSAATLAAYSSFSFDLGGVVATTIEIGITFSGPMSEGYFGNASGFGFNFTRFFIQEIDNGGGGGSVAAPSSWLTFCGLAERERWRSVVAPGSALRYWSTQAEGVVSLWPAMSATQTIFADGLHLPIPLAVDADNWGWLPVGGERLIICFGASRLCEVRRDDPRLGPLAPIFLAEFMAGVERLREDVPFDVRHLFDSITAARIPALGR